MNCSEPETVFASLLAGQEAVDVLYEFRPALDLIRASFSGGYWDIHKALEGQGKLTHDRERCPDRDGPREILVWNSDTGWKHVAVPQTHAP